MKNTCLILVVCFWPISGTLGAELFGTDIAPLIEASCIYCHDADTETELNFEKFGHELTDPDIFRDFRSRTKMVASFTIAS